jgi:hypothetical protein
MRHVIFLPPPLAVAAGAFGMGKTPAAAPLIAPAGGALRFAAGRLRTGLAAIGLAMVAAATDDDLGAAAPAQEESTHRVHRLSPFNSPNPIKRRISLPLKFPPH